MQLTLCPHPFSIEGFFSHLRLWDRCPENIVLTLDRAIEFHFKLNNIKTQFRNHLPSHGQTWDSSLTYKPLLNSVLDVTHFWDLFLLSVVFSIHATYLRVCKEGRNQFLEFCMNCFSHNRDKGLFSYPTWKQMDVCGLTHSPGFLPKGCVYWVLKVQMFGLLIVSGIHR